jgi:2,4-dienoyl-CoA reductase-like NADH-dependent reductase (Old Yellow Enzyme family)
MNGMSLANRFVRSATWENLAEDDGTVTSKLIALMVRLAKGNVGLIIPGMSYIHDHGKSYRGQIGISDDKHIAGLKVLTDAVHEAGGKVALQIAHGGAHTNPKLTSVECLGPSALATDEGPVCQEMDLDSIEDVIEAFRNAAVRAKEAGFDAVQLHAAHGYLLSQFLSPFYNRRSDEYGGSVENRIKLVLDVYEQVRTAVGETFPVLVKLNATDFLEDGLKPGEAITVAKALCEKGIDAIELSGGTVWGFRILGDANKGSFRRVREEAYYRDTADELKKEIEATVIVTGGVRSYEVAKDIIEKGIADYIGLCRPFIREPDLVRRWETGDTEKSGCVSDNACFRPIYNGEGPLCVHSTKR